MRRIVLPGFLPVLATAFATGLAVAAKGKGNDKKFEYAVGLWGDMPYSDAQAQTGSRT